MASNFHNAFSLTVPNMAPGFGYAVYPNLNDQTGRQHIMVAGDGDHAAHCMYPSGEAADFTYDNEVFKNAGGTVGALAFTDYDEDGMIEVWMPNYDHSYVMLFTLDEVATEFLQ